jgi:hypothetical protein
MSENVPQDWQPDPITRLQALAAALPGSVTARRIVESPFDKVWAVLSDLERSVPIYEAQVERLRIVGRGSDHLDLEVELVDGRRQETQARLTEGWCLMQSAETVVAMAARPVGTRTLVAHLEHARPTADPRPVRPDVSDDQQAKLLREIAVIERLAREMPADPR